MLVGKQENFALEYTFDEFFDQTFIASGRFIRAEGLIPRRLRRNEGY